MKNQTEVLLQVVGVLDDLRIAYYVVGSVASSLYGVSRATGDVDIVADVKPAHIAPLFNALKEDFYIDDLAIRRSIQYRRPFNVIHFDSLNKVDVYSVPDDDFSRQELARRRREALVPGTDASPAKTVYLATPEDTILSKLRWYRQGGGASERQLDDVAGVIKVQAGRLDLDYLREWADRLHVIDLLEQLLGRNG